MSRNRNPHDPRQLRLQAPADARPLRLSARDSQAFAEALLNPPEPNDALRNAKARYDKLVKR